MRRYRLSKSAENDLSEIWNYTKQTWGEIQAERYLNKLEARFLDLAAERSKGRPRIDIDLEYLCYHEGKHLIFYQPYQGGIAVARVLHERMDIAGQIEDDPVIVHKPRAKQGY